MKLTGVDLGGAEVSGEMGRIKSSPCPGSGPAGMPGKAIRAVAAEVAAP